MDGIVEGPEGYLTRKVLLIQNSTNSDQPFSLGMNST